MARRRKSRKTSSPSSMSQESDSKPAAVASSNESDDSKPPAAAVMITEDAKQAVIEATVEAFSRNFEESLVASTITARQEEDDIPSVDVEAMRAAVVERVRAMVENNWHEIMRPTTTINDTTRTTGNDDIAAASSVTRQRTDQDDVVCTMESLPNELLLFILSFCDYKDTLSVVELSTHFRDRIEAVSQAELEQMRHRTDDYEAWNERVFIHAGRRLKYQPSRLPRRYVLKRAKEVPLYTLDTANRYNPNDMGFRLALHPNGETLITCRNQHRPGDGTQNGIQVWDLNATPPRLVRTIPVFISLDRLDYLQFLGGLIVAVSRWRDGAAAPYNVDIAVYSLDGVLRYSDESAVVTDKKGNCPVFTTSGDKLFMITHTSHDDRFALSILEVSSTRDSKNRTVFNFNFKTHPITIHHWNKVVSAAAVGNWLVVRFNYDALFVFNTLNPLQKHGVAGSFDFVERAQDGSGFVALESGKVSIMTVSEKGRIVPLRSFQTRFVYFPVGFPFIPSIKSHAYLPFDGRVGEDRTILVVDTTSGETVRSLLSTEGRYGFYPQQLATNGREIFCVIESWELFHDYSGPIFRRYVTKAYPAN